MARRLDAVDAAFHVFFLSEGSRERSWMSSDEEREFDHEFIPSVELPVRSRRPRVPIGLGHRLREFRPDVLLSSGFSPLVSRRVAAFARSRGAVFGLWSGEHASMSTAHNPLRRADRRRLMASADFAIAYGHAAAGYLKGLRPKLPVVYGRNTSTIGQVAHRKDFQSEIVEILAVGDLASARKGVDVLIRALARVPTLSCRLTVTGGGRLMSDLQKLAREDQRVRFTGPLPRARVLASYAEADVFAFPSRADVFGLALVEAMSSGLATITTHEPGAVADLCLHEHNSIIVGNHEPQDWADSLARIVEDKDLQRFLGENARRTILARWTLEHAVDAMLAGLRLGVLATNTGSRN
jgi:glycosyltransferase involved in cell wall biosynthesis